jgi:hypothetical protein
MLRQEAPTKYGLKFGILGVVLLTVFAASVAGGQTSSAADELANFAPIEQWKNTVLAGNAAGLKALYSTDPAAQVEANSIKGDAGADTSFWLGLKARNLKLEAIRATAPQPDARNFILHVEATGLPDGRTVTVTDVQAWRKQGEQWRLVGVDRTDAPHLKQPSDMKKDIYPANANAQAELKEAEDKAAREHKRVLLVFGANWCFDCHVLDLAFQRPDLAPVLAAGYEVVHIDLGIDEHKNADLVKQYDVPLNKGIPALAVVESNGALVVSQKNGEFENARAVTPEALLDFLNKWKPEAR